MCLGEGFRPKPLGEGEFRSRGKVVKPSEASEQIGSNRNLSSMFCRRACREAMPWTREDFSSLATVVTTFPHQVGKDCPLAKEEFLARIEGLGCGFLKYQFRAEH
jgi:hypothetical protein